MAVIRGTNGKDDAILGIGTPLIGTTDDDNVLGLDGNDFISGGGGNDDLDGGADNDFIQAGRGGNTILRGGSGNDQLFGGDGNDTLDGGIGDDVMQGGVGNNIYAVNSFNDTVIEFDNGGRDLIIAQGVSYNLPNGVEELQLHDLSDSRVFADLNGRGNNLDNVIIGSNGRNVLDGKEGADTMQGGFGDDMYTVDNVLDQVIEQPDNELSNGGLDTVGASVSFKLPDYVEELVLQGTANLNGTGNRLNNEIVGNAGNNLLTDELGSDTLLGGGGNDTLVGGAGDDFLRGGVGADCFTFQANQLFAKANLGVDTLDDFIHGTDKIVLGKTAFKAIKSTIGHRFSVSKELAVVSSETVAKTSRALITYNKNTGHLFYNQNGAAAGLGTGAQFASLPKHAALTASDFVIQA